MLPQSACHLTNKNCQLSTVNCQLSTVNCLLTLRTFLCVFASSVQDTLA
ncbi:MAG: hypothetical protein JGK01_02970 [Microcoleus sp. PH2017_03_ELD_O_A]|nr:hypothetical protein [Microcoleus sp. PH2017_04_SCI_O_A]MCC3440780.1 hypothetical protein [Microcoleus sp. PH2017_03_ELD_O_A]